MIPDIDKRAESNLTCSISFFFFFQKRVQTIKIGTLIKNLSRLYELQVSDLAEHKQTQWKTCLIAWRDNNIIPPMLPTFVNRLPREFDRNTNNLSNSRRRSELLLFLACITSASLVVFIPHHKQPLASRLSGTSCTNAHKPRHVFDADKSKKHLNISLFSKTSRDFFELQLSVRHSRYQQVDEFTWHRFTFHRAWLSIVWLDSVHTARRVTACQSKDRHGTNVSVQRAASNGSICVSVTHQSRVRTLERASKATPEAV